MKDYKDISLRMKWLSLLRCINAVLYLTCCAVQYNKAGHTRGF
uniref:Uncharacterized protein n=1 Tax=Rheinheimera sp. BAL341 TaxID=1708203 RepID=A0A486XHB3_9GAMM